MTPNRFKVLVLGGYGNFGKRICESLASPSLGLQTAVHLIIAGRHPDKARHLCAQLETTNPSLTTQAIALDINSDSFEQQLGELSPNLVIHTSGPFQGQLYHVPRACIAAGVHYIDLADDRRFVCDITELNRDAADAGVLVVSGASSVPALSSAVVDHFSSEFQSLERLEYAIAPGNQLERGFATIKAILSYTGHPFTTWTDGRWQIVYGWMNSIKKDFGAPIGKRHLANIDIPDLELFPNQYPSLKSVRFRAGLELSAMHNFMVFMAWFAKKGIVKNWAPFTGISLSISNWFYSLGTDTGGMQVELTGRDHNNQCKTIVWTLIAENGVGPYIPTIPAILVAKRLINNAISETGATPCVGLFSLTDFLDFAAQWKIYTRTESPINA